MKEAYPDIKQSFGLFGLYVATSLLAGFAFIGLSGGSTETLDTFLMTIFINVVIIAIGLNFKEANFSYLIGGKVKTAPVVFLLVVLFDLFLVIFLDPIIELIPMPDFFQKMFEELLQKDIWTYLTIAIVAPVTEELIFRRIILDGLEKNYGARKAILWSAFFFALFHMNPWQGIGAFCLGLLIGWVYLKTRNIWLCIFFHFFNNSVAFLGFYLTDDPNTTMTDFTGYDYRLALVMGLSLVGMYFCYKFLDRHFKKQNYGSP